MHENDHIDDYAKKLVGNWRKFDSFGWGGRPDDANEWCIVYTHNRDSGLREQSNAKQIAKALEPFCSGDNADCVRESHGHWACGHIDGFSIRVYKDASHTEVTEAFKTYARLLLALENYPVLNSFDLSEMEYEATLENINTEGRSLFELDEPEGWEGKVYSWLSDNNQSALENGDESGGYPTKEQIQEALDGLEIAYVNTVERVYNMYSERVKTLMNSIKDEIESEGLNCSELFESDLLFFTSLLSITSKVNSEKRVHVSFMLEDSTEHETKDKESGINFSIELTGLSEEDSVLLGKFAPHNFTSECWVALDNEKAIEERFNEFAQMDTSELVYMVKEFFK